MTIRGHGDRAALSLAIGRARVKEWKLTKRLETAVEFEFPPSLDSGPSAHGVARYVNRTAVVEL